MKSLKDLRTNENIIYDINEITKHQNSSSKWIAEQDYPTDDEIKEFFNCNDEDLPKKKLELFDKKYQANYGPEMVLQYGKSIVNESLEIKKDENLSSVDFVDLLKVKTLTIIECKNIRFGPHPTQVQHLKVSNCQLTKVMYLDQITQLVSLDLSCNALRFVSEVGELVLLKQLILKDNKIAYIENWISELKVLEHLDIGNNKLLTVKQLLDLKQLVTVELQGNMALDIDYLKRHKNFQKSWKSVQASADVQDYEYYLGENRNDEMIQYKMKQLQLEKYNLDNAAKYEDLINNQELIIHGDRYLCDLGFIDPINNFVQRNTNILVVQYCQNVDTQNIPRNLTKLQLNNNGLTRINGLEFVLHLTSVNLSQNNLSDVQQLQNLVHVEELFINDNKINGLDCLEKLTALKTLEVKNNKLFEIKVVRFWVQVFNLSVDGNFINDFAALFNHPNYKPMWISKQIVANTTDIKQHIGQNTSQEQIDAELLKYNNYSAEKRKVDQDQIQAFKKKIKSNCLEIADNTEIQDLNFLNLFKLAQLTLRNCVNVKFDYACNVTVLSVTHSGLSELNGIQQMSQLQTLDLSNNQLQNASLLSQLVNLQALTLTNNKLLEVFFISELSQLKQLVLNKNMIYHWEPVRNHQNFNQSWLVPQNKPTENDIINRFGEEMLQNEKQTLQTQFMEPNQIEEEKMISRYQNNVQIKVQITVFNATQIQQEQIGQIRNCEHESLGNNVRLTCSQLECQNITNIIKEINSELKMEVEEFRYLEIQNENELENLSSVNGLNIHKLVVENCENVKLHKVGNVKVLHVKWCKLQNLEGIQNWKQLQELDLSGNKLQNITQLEKLTKLKVLSLSGNEIINIDCLKELVNLTTLSVSSNQVISIESLQNLINLTNANLYQNKIQNIDSLRKLANLTHLNIYSNQINCVDSLKELNKLIKLDISKNKIKDFNPIQNHPNFSQYKIGSQK
ncbi:Leucine_rich repeats-containing protein [Hexamita inflata]|uniref:Leucine_rich repeats-containing protein n=1 Tax=Hexamita inflata TaxID=28002 RepID=A0ABP1H6L8_9EUKA